MLLLCLAFFVQWGVPGLSVALTGLRGVLGRNVLSVTSRKSVLRKTDASQQGVSIVSVLFHS